MGKVLGDSNSYSGNHSSLYPEKFHEQSDHNHSHQHHEIYDDKPTYALEHLATFKLKHESESHKPVEKMKILMEMDRTNRILPQKMFMCFNSQWVAILDKDKTEIESFPGPLIQNPTAFISNDPLEMYNNILVFSVSGSSLGNSEMHVFQVEDASAVHLVEDLKLLRNGIIITKRRENKQNSSKQPPKDQDKYGIKEVISSSRDNETAQVTAERDIMVLNHCFEDIEKFVLRLHYASEALRELEIRKKEHTLNTNPHGEGLLILRSRPPLENEFIDILAKFKLGFNFIVRLEKYISDPKVPISRMFISLETIVTVCNDVYTNGRIPESVVNPLLRRETVNLLNVSLNVKEKEFWLSLGKNWTLPKDQFKDHKGSYHPIFFDDWSPDFIVDEPVPYLPQQQPKIEEKVHLSEGSNNTWHKKLQSRNARIAEVTFPREAKTDRELTVSKGEYLEVVDDSRKWWKTRNSQGQIGYVPNTILKPQNFEAADNHNHVDKQIDAMSLSPSLYEQECSRPNRNTVYTYEPDREQVKTALTRRSFSVPMIPPPPPPPPTADETHAATHRTPQTEIAAVGALVAMRARNDCDADSLSVHDEMHNELRQTLMLREKRKDLEILKTPQIYIEQSSRPKEVEEWLRGKGFSDAIIKKLHGLNGNELFALSNDTIEGYFGVKESRRLISQIILQKGFSGYKTTRSSELQAILARARKKVGDPNSDASDEIF